MEKPKVDLLANTEVQELDLIKEVVIEVSEENNENRESDDKANEP